VGTGGRRPFAGQRQRGAGGEGGDDEVPGPEVGQMGALRVVVPVLILGAGALLWAFRRWVAA